MAVLACVALAVYATWTDFVPSELVANVAPYLCGAVSLGLGVFIWHGVATRRFKFPDQPRLGSRWTVYALGMAGVYCLAWLAVARAVPDILTRIFGTHESRSMILEASSERRRSCYHQLQGPELPFPGHLCVSSSEIGRFAPRGEVILSGPSTMLGLHVTQIEPGAE
jgi:hypothetical protein